MRDVSRKSTERVIQQAEELINTSKFENRINDNIYPLREIHVFIVSTAHVRDISGR